MSVYERSAVGEIRLDLPDVRFEPVEGEFVPIMERHPSLDCLAWGEDPQQFLNAGLGDTLMSLFAQMSVRRREVMISIAADQRRKLYVQTKAAGGSRIDVSNTMVELPDGFAKRFEIHSHPTTPIQDRFITPPFQSPMDFRSFLFDREGSTNQSEVVTSEGGSAFAVKTAETWERIARKRRQILRVHRHEHPGSWAFLAEEEWFKTWGRRLHNQGQMRRFAKSMSEEYALWLLYAPAGSRQVECLCRP